MSQGQGHVHFAALSPLPGPCRYNYMQGLAIFDLSFKVLYMDENVQFETYSNYILHKFDPVEGAPPSTIPPIPECMPAGRQSLLCLNVRRPTFSLGRWAVAVGSNPDNTCMDPFHFKIFPGIEDQIMRPLGTCMHHKLNLDKGTGTGDCGTS